MAALTLEQVQRVAQLSALTLTDGEASALAEELGAVLQHMRALESIDVAGVEPTFHPIPLETPLREDRVAPSLARDAALAAAPEKDAGGFAVPKVLDGEG